jgi:hypothetical protein
MNNQELTTKLQEILSNENYFDMIEAALAFEKEYKQSEFYKKTKMSLMDALKGQKVWQIANFNLKTAVNKTQEYINSLDLSNLTNIIDQAGELFDIQNTEILNAIQEVKNITL